jgi:hypothetical protein
MQRAGSSGDHSPRREGETNAPRIPRSHRTREQDIDLTFDVAARIGRSLVPAALAELPAATRVA